MENSTNYTIDVAELTENNKILCSDDEKAENYDYLNDEYDISLQKKPIYEAVKRVFDIVASALALIILSPVFLITIIAIVIDDPGNPFFSQERVGKNGKKFKIYKFRSMRTDAEEHKKDYLDCNESNGPLFKIAKDPRVTRVGRFIRKTSIDELPQLINILKNDMSVIGPRPFIPSEQQLLPDFRLLVKPGLSCYWQIGGKNSLTEEEQLELDKKYINERSVSVDIKIILITLAEVLHLKNS
ncbi:MAG: sugar transferase [Oscillospiraceae bacterium]